MKEQDDTWKGVVIVLFISVGLYGLYYSMRPGRKEDPLDQKYDSIYFELNEQLNRSSTERDILLDSIRSLDSINRTYNMEINKLNNELKSIKGRYKKFTKSELENEMERRASEK
jgi:hypothetical protein